MQVSDKIYVAGHKGMVGSAIVRKLMQLGYNNLLLRTSAELDLKDSNAVGHFFEKERPDYVFVAAAKVGGIMANQLYKADFIYENLMIQTNVIHHSYKNKVKKLLFLGSSCIYPKFAEQPIKESSLLTGLLEDTNDAYAIAKIAGIKMCEAYRTQYGCNFISAMPTNLYGPNDNYDPSKSHVLPSLLQKIYHAKKNGDPEVTVWGSGLPRREFLHVHDLADACVFLMQNYNGKDIVNVGSGTDVSIAELAELIKKTVGYDGALRFDRSKPDGTPRKLLDVSKLAEMGWRYSIGLEEGIFLTYADYRQANPIKKEKKSLQNKLEHAL
jgi:GDP-L-fucose synthase